MVSPMVSPYRYDPARDAMLNYTLPFRADSFVTAVPETTSFVTLPPAQSFGSFSTLMPSASFGPTGGPDRWERGRNVTDLR